MASAASSNVSSDIQPYSMHVSQLHYLRHAFADMAQVSARYLDLTKQKLELTRLPKEAALPEENPWALGTPKSTLEPLIDYW
jgi:hypothetical protein